MIASRMLPLWYISRVASLVTYQRIANIWRDRVGASRAEAKGRLYEVEVVEVEGDVIRIRLLLNRHRQDNRYRLKRQGLVRGKPEFMLSLARTLRHPTLWSQVLY